jgi:YHS domain-containing protein
MKMTHYSLVATFVAILAAVDAPHNLSASEALDIKSAVSASSSSDQLLAQAATKKPAANAPTVNVDQNGVILKGYDAVAYFKQKKAVKGDPKYSSTYGGATYYFASAADKATFDKSPAKYAPQYGGYCANAMLKGKLNDIDPNAFLVYNGKLYVCTGEPQLKHFRAKPEANVKAADEKWKQYQPPTNPGFRRELGS